MKRCALVAAFPALAAAIVGGCAKEEPMPPPERGSALTMTQGADLSNKALEILNAKCTVCHSAERFSGKAFTTAEWNAVLELMLTKGATLSGEELDSLRHWRKAP